jgi:hypothetical protein
MNQSELKIWFPEPLVEDESFARKDEGWFDWVSRATSKKGKACRAFLNAQICKVPASWQSKLYQDFKTRVWDSVLFELIVARTMQILGASIEVEVPVAGTNKRPDFLAQFPDSLITVEATVPEINEPMNQQLARNEDLIEIIERLMPQDWSVRIWRLPRIGANDSKQALKKRMEEVLAQLPPAQNFTDKSTEIDFELDFGNDGELFVTVVPQRNEKRAATVRGVVSGVDNTEQRIRAAIRRKKKQVKKTGTPVILAVRTDAFGDMEDYDRALFGLTFEHVDHTGKTIAAGFDPVGLLAKTRPERPTYAAVLAYTAAAIPRVNDPVLYIHQGFEGSLPRSLLKLEVRTLQATGIHIETARMKKILEELNLVY